MLLELSEQSTKHKTLNGQDRRQIPNFSRMNPAVQHKKVPKSKKNGNPVENLSWAAPRFRNKDVLDVDFK